MVKPDNNVWGACSIMLCCDKYFLHRTWNISFFYILNRPLFKLKHIIFGLWLVFSYSLMSHTRTEGHYYFHGLMCFMYVLCTVCDCICTQPGSCSVHRIGDMCSFRKDPFFSPSVSSTCYTLLFMHKCASHVHVIVFVFHDLEDLGNCLTCTE